MPAEDLAGAEEHQPRLTDLQITDEQIAADREAGYTDHDRGWWRRPRSDRRRCLMSNVVKLVTKAQHAQKRWDVERTPNRSHRNFDAVV